MPLQFAKFSDEFRVAGVGPGYGAALGARLVKVGDVPVAEAWRRVLTLTPRAELMELRQEDALIYLARGYALHGLDITPDRNHTVYTLRDDADHLFTLDVQGLKPGETVQMTSGYSDNALRYQKRDVAFWCVSHAPLQRLTAYRSTRTTRSSSCDGRMPHTPSTCPARTRTPRSAGTMPIIASSARSITRSTDRTAPSSRPRS